MLRNFDEEYRSKLVSAAEAAKVIKSGDFVDYGWCTTTTNAVDKAFAERITEVEDVNIFGGVLLREPEIFKVEDSHKHITWNTWHAGGLERRMIGAGKAFYSPIKYSEVPGFYRQGFQKMDVAVMQVSPMDKFGYFNFGTSPSHSMAVCENAKIVILEVNKNIPVCHGGYENAVHISMADMIVEGENPAMSILPGPGEATEVDLAVARSIVNEIQDGACIQLGIGGMPSAVGSLIAKSDLKDLGVHSEMYVDSFVEMANAGKVTGAKKSIDRYRQTFAFAAGSQDLYDYLNNNPEIMAAPVDYVNDVRTVSKIDNFMSINNAVDLDLFGQINAESAGTKHISGAGGQLDFVIGAYLSKGGKSFICCSSSYKTKDGELKSRIRPTLETGSIVTDTRSNTHFVVTEYGMANLKGKTTWQRAEALINIAHPEFREELIKEAEKLKIWRKTNK